MTEPVVPFFLDGRRIGSVHDVVPHSGFFRGRLALDGDDARPVFDAVVALAAAVDTCSPDDYQTAWHDWSRGCGELQDLQLWIGDAKTPIEEFAIESDWSIEWRNMDSEFAGL